MATHTYEILTSLRENYWNPECVFKSAFFFSWAIFLWDLYLSYRQYKVYKNTNKLPLEMCGFLDQDTFSKSRDYHIDTSTFGFIHSLWSQYLSTFILLFNVLPFIWHKSGQILEYFGLSEEYEITQSIVFSIISTSISFLLSIPWLMYSIFVIEEKHGFNKQTLSFFFKDRLKKFVINQIFSNLILSLVVYIIQISNDYLFLYLWIVFTCLIFIGATIYADYIAPLFDKYTPLAEGELREEIEALAKSLDFPLKKIYIVEGSKRSSHSNAYLYGFFKNKRIVIFDTLIENYKSVLKGGDSKLKGDFDNEIKNTSENKEETNTQNKNEDYLSNQKRSPKGCNKDEILAVLAHELGHWKLSHILKGLLFTEVQMLFTFALFGMLYKDPVVYEAFGFSSKPILMGLIIVFQFIIMPLFEVVNFVMINLTRHFEFQADNFAKKLGKASDLRSALIKIDLDNLGFPIYDPWYSAFHLSHPSLLERLREIGKID